MTAHPHRACALACALFSVFCCSVSARAAESLQSECQSEATLYEIPEEQQADYVAGCIASRGGDYSIGEAGEDTVAQDSDEAAEAGNDAEPQEPYPQ